MKIKTWEVSIWPNNQPPIFVGYYEAESSMDARIKVVQEMVSQNMDLNLNSPELCVLPKSNNTPLQKWNQTNQKANVKNDKEDKNYL